MKFTCIANSYSRMKKGFTSKKKIYELQSTYSNRNRKRLARDKVSQRRIDLSLSNSKHYEKNINKMPTRHPFMEIPRDS